MVAKGNPKRITSVRDLARRGVRFVNRQSDSGTRYLFDLLLAKHKVDDRAIQGYDTSEFTHAAVAAYVASGMADVGFGVETPARKFGSGFHPTGKRTLFLPVPRRKRKLANNHRRTRDPAHANISQSRRQTTRLQRGELRPRPTRERSIQIAKLFQPPPPVALCSHVYKTLYTGHAQAQIDGDRAQEARGPRRASGTCSPRTASNGRKKGVSWLLLCTSKEVTRDIQSRKLLLYKDETRAKSLDSRFRGNDEQNQRAGFQRSLE